MVLLFLVWVVLEIHGFLPLEMYLPVVVVVLLISLQVVLVKEELEVVLMLFLKVLQPLRILVAAVVAVVKVEVDLVEMV
tara:strand:- start:133 stop:369 length:237 start_codon:yes stop_codon:yes gene_type:complete